MKYLILAILPLAAHAENKSDSFMRSCESTLVRMMTIKKPENKAVIPKLAQRACTDMTSLALTTPKRKWDTIPDHKREGCLYAVYFLAREASEAEQERLNAQFCD